MKKRIKLKEKFAALILVALVLSPFTSLALAEDAATIPPAAPSSTVETPAPAPEVTTPPVEQPAPMVEQQTVPAPPEEQTVSIPEKDAEVTPLPIEDKKSEDSQNHQSEETNDKGEIDLDNDAVIENEINGNANTGNNDANANDGDVSISTGDAEIALSVLNLINSSLLSLSPDGIKFVVKNSNGEATDIVIDLVTGDISTLKDGPVILGNINNLNNADLRNFITLIGNTGYNQANRNDGNVALNTGDVNLSVNLLNFLNSTFVVGSFGSVGVLNIFGDLNGDVVVPDLNTGQKTEMSLLDKILNFIGINNKSVVNNEINVDANTGGNEAKGNDGDTAITTGSITQMLSLSNLANFNFIGDTVYMAVINVLGKWNGQKLMEPLVALFTSGNDESLASMLTNKAKITNNSVLTNIINLFANTGNNAASRNDGSTSITTGNVSILTNIMNLSNFNIIANRFVFLVINVFGDWNGDIVLASKQSPEEVKNTIQSVNQIIEPAEEKESPVKRAIYREMDSEKEEQPFIVSDFGQGSSSNPTYGNSFDFEKPQTNAVTSFVLDNINQLFLYGFLVYLLALVIYFARRKSKLHS